MTRRLLPSCSSSRQQLRVRRMMENENLNLSHSLHRTLDGASCLLQVDLFLLQHCSSSSHSHHSHQSSIAAQVKRFGVSSPTMMPMKPRFPRHPTSTRTPDSLSVQAEDVVHRMFSSAPVRIFNNYRFRGDGYYNCWDGNDFPEFRRAAEQVQHYLQRHFRSLGQGGCSLLQLGRTHYLSLSDAVNRRSFSEKTVYPRSNPRGGGGGGAAMVVVDESSSSSFLYPLFLAKFLILNDYVDFLSLPMSHISNSGTFSSYLQKVCDEEYEIFHAPGPRQFITQHFLSRQSLTRLELGICDDYILATIGENLWGLVQLNLTLSHHSSDCGLIRLMHKKIPDEYRKVRQLSMSVIAGGGKITKEQIEEMSSVRKPGKVTLEELKSFVDKDVEKFGTQAAKMRGCPFLKSLVLQGDIGCYELEDGDAEGDARAIMFRCGLHLILYECPEMTSFEIRPKAGSPTQVSSLAFRLIADYQRITGDQTIFQRCLQSATVTFRSQEPREEEHAVLQGLTQCCSTLNVVDANGLVGFGQRFPEVRNFDHLSSLLLLHAGFSTLLEILPQLHTLTTVTLGVEFRTPLSDLLHLRRNLGQCRRLKRLHVVFEGARSEAEKGLLEPSEWIPALGISFKSLASLHPSVCKNRLLRSKMNSEGGNSLFREVMEYPMMRDVVRDIFVNASPVLGEVREGDGPQQLEELELSGMVHWAQGVVLAMKMPNVTSFRYNPMREFELENFLFVRDLRMALLPYLLVLDTRNLRQITVAGQDDLFCDIGKIRELIQAFSESPEMPRLEYLFLGRSLYYSFTGDKRLRSLVRLIAAGEFRNSFQLDVVHGGFDQNILEAIAIKPDLSRFYTIPQDQDFYVF